MAAVAKSISKRLSQKPSSKASLTENKVVGVQTGISGWYQMYDDESGKYFFYNKSTKKTAWGLPLRDVLPEAERNPHNKAGSSDWVVCVDPMSGKKFFQSNKIKRVQWTVPLLFKQYLDPLPYFAIQKRVSMVGATPQPGVATPMLKRQPSMNSLLSSIHIEDVLEDSQACAAFHRFLVASHAEENILFFGAAEVYRKGEWKGMKVIGEQSESVKDDEEEGEAMLRQQMLQTRASVRLGFQPTNVRSAQARQIYDKFLKQDAPMEICVERKVAEKVLDMINSSEEDEDRTMFLQVQEEVLRNMGEDLLPRFLRIALAADSGVKDLVVGEKDNTFKTDAVVQTALRRIAGISEA
jgi:hypothetical protein